jgi:hypothetical protein
MAGRRAEDLRRELESEREGLTEAVEDLRHEGSRLKARLPIVLGGALASLIGLRAARRLVRR